MIIAGIDVGIENIKAVILKDRKIIARGTGLSGGASRAKNSEQVWKDTLAAAKLSPSDVVKVVATGQGKGDVSFAGDCIVEPVADARAARFLYPKATSVVDIGADQVRLVALGKGDTINEVVMNQKCAAGLGLLLKSVARMLGMTLEDINRLKENGRPKAVVNDGCAVFAEMDALGLLNRGVPREEVALAVVEAVAVRVNSILHDKFEPAKDSTVLIGGVSKNNAIVKILENRSHINFLIPEYGEYAGALGAALIAAD
jgi:predicted CoA-substrate-specific enzyme activase